MKIAIASDSQGMSLKRYLAQRLNAVGDSTIYTYQLLEQMNDDYAVISKLSLLLRSRTAEKAILICTNAVRASMNANKHCGVRAAVCDEAAVVRDCVHQENLNFLILALKSVTRESAGAIVDSFVTTRFSVKERDYGIPPVYLKRIIAYIRNNLHVPLDSTRLASFARLSPSHFSKLFKISLGISPYQFILRERIERSKDLLRNSEIPIAEVASRVGFETQAHFTNVFGNFVGMPPRQFRRHITEFSNQPGSQSLSLMPSFDEKTLLNYENSQEHSRRFAAGISLNADKRKSREPAIGSDAA